MMHRQDSTPTELIHDIVAVEAEMAYVEALLRMHLVRAERQGDQGTIERIRQIVA